MSDTDPGLAPTLLAAPPPAGGGSSRDDDTEPRGRRPPGFATEPEDGVSTAELRRAVAYVEQKADRALRELDGEGANPGVRGFLHALKGDVRGLQQDVDHQRSELLSAIEARAAETRAELRLLTAAVARLEARRVSPWILGLLVICALVVACAAGFGAWGQL